MKYVGKTGEYLDLKKVTKEDTELILSSRSNELSILWFKKPNNHLKIDSVDYTFNENDFIFLTEFHLIEIIHLHETQLLRWNRPFYCILNHDSEIGCKGVLFYGASNLPTIKPNLEEKTILETVWQMLELEMNAKDKLQQEMLQMMLKRILILCTRIFKRQINYQYLDTTNTDIIREYNFFVEQHFREKHTVADYATLLNKSPKTLSNLFKKIGNKSPLQFIHDRKMLEARRLLCYTDKTVSEIGYELGFNDVQSFSRFFKKQEGRPPVEFKNYYQ